MLYGDTVMETAAVQESIETPKESVTSDTVSIPAVTKAAITEAPKASIPQILPEPEMSPDATAYPKYVKIKDELDRQNKLILEADHERGNQHP